MEPINGSMLPSLDRRPYALGNLELLPDEIICTILSKLSRREVAVLSCVSSVMYMFCNEEPLWMILCLGDVSGMLQYKGSWKKTALFLENVSETYLERCSNHLYFHGFSSLFLYRRFYRCNTKLDCFEFDSGNVDRKESLTLHEFSNYYDGRKPVLISGLSDSWPAKTSWTIDNLCQKYGETPFQISQISARKISMKLSDYFSYMKQQHDEDPLYIFDAKFGESAPSLLNEYSVPDLFQEDWLDVLDEEERPPYRWLVIGPERSGASWHVDPALTSAWNTLLCGKKRWALYPPGKVPFGVTVHVNDEDGDVNIDTPSSLQWWLDYYPLISDEEKPIECTQMAGETIFIPSGWWHCVLNLENTVAVTQNFVNDKNFEYVCLDMAPGYVHKGVSRAGLLAIDEEIPNLTFSYDTQFLSTFLTEDKDHFASPWCVGNCIDQRIFRQWLSKLWTQKPEMQPLLWKGACIALNADTWLSRLHKICSFYKIPFPSTNEKLPSGFGSNPVYLVGDYAVKILVEGGVENALYCLGSELQIQDTIKKQNSSLKNHVPEVLACGILNEETVIPWEATKLPDFSLACNVSPKDDRAAYAYGVWARKLHESAKAEESDVPEMHESVPVYPFIITQRFHGKTYAQIRGELSPEESLSLASFLGELARTLHLLPYPSFESERELFLTTLSKNRTAVVRRLRQWGYPIPDKLIDQVDYYISHYMSKLTENIEEKMRSFSWIHSDIMDDNVVMEYSDGWRGKYLLDFSDINIGDRLLDVIPIYLDIFRGDRNLIEKFLGSYGLSLGDSYLAMCYCILHEENVLSSIFDTWKDLRMADSWEEVEVTVWGFLNQYNLTPH